MKKRYLNDQQHLDENPKSKKLYCSKNQKEFDFVVIGFGPVALALAVQLYYCLNENQLSVLFLEKQPGFAWHPNLLLEGTYAQNHFFKDLVTQVDPTSKFTFVNYLHQNERLQKFMNLDLNYISRHECNDYMKWAANYFSKWVQYSSIVQAISPVLKKDEQRVDRMRVEYLQNGIEREVYARNIVYAMGQTPYVPSIFRDSLGERVFHAWDFGLRFQKIIDEAPNQRIAIAGNGQSAAQIFNYLLDKYPRGQVINLMRSKGYKPADDSPFTNEVFEPKFVDYFNSLVPDRQKQVLLELRSTNYGVVQKELIQKIYERLYQREVRDQLGFSLRGYTSVTGAELIGDCVRLTVEEVNTGATDLIDCDYAILSTGYRSMDVLERALLPVSDYLIRDKHEQIQVGRDYQILTDSRMENIGLYALGYAEHSHGLTETLLSLLPIRTKTVLNSLLKRMPLASYLCQT